MTVQLIPRPVALAKLLQLGHLTHDQAATYCGWGSEGFTRAAREAHAAGLITFRNVGGTRVYRAGVSTRRGRYRAWQ